MTAETIQSTLAKSEVYPELYIAVCDRKWEVIMIEEATFRAKTIDNQPPKKGRVADFRYSSEMVPSII